MVAKKRPHERSIEDIEQIVEQLKSVAAFQGFNDDLLRGLSELGYFEELDEVFYEDQLANNWFIIIGGTVDVMTAVDKRNESLQKVCSLSQGVMFGEEMFTPGSHCCTVITKTQSQFLRIPLSDFGSLWKMHQEQFGTIITPLRETVANFQSDRQNKIILSTKPAVPPIQETSILTNITTDSFVPITTESIKDPINIQTVIQSPQIEQHSFDSVVEEPKRSYHQPYYSDIAASPERFTNIFDHLDNQDKNNVVYYYSDDSDISEQVPTESDLERLTTKDHISSIRKQKSSSSRTLPVPPHEDPTPSTSGAEPTNDLVRQPHHSSEPDLIADLSREGRKSKRALPDVPQRTGSWQTVSNIDVSPSRPAMSDLSPVLNPTRQNMSRHGYFIAESPRQKPLTKDQAAYHESAVDLTIRNPRSRNATARRAIGSTPTGDTVLPRYYSLPFEPHSPMQRKSCWLPSPNVASAVSDVEPPSINEIPLSDLMRSSRPLYAQGFLQAAERGLSGTSIGLIDTVRTMLEKCGNVMRTVMVSSSAHMMRDRKFHLNVYNRCMVGTEMVDWLMRKFPLLVQNRTQAVGMLQALLEEGFILHVTNEFPFLDKYLFYRWPADSGHMDRTVPKPSMVEQESAHKQFESCVQYLALVGPDSLFRMILQKPPHARTIEDLDVIYHELLHIKALSHLSTMVKREVSKVLMLEQQSNAGTLLFNQGEEAKSWYIILKGSVNVVIHGKGVVATLHEGDDFGKLALVNDAPRAATIVLREDNCHFLRVDKHDFNDILRDVEAHTVRLREHGRDVLVLEKIPVKRPGEIYASRHRYSVMAGTPEKMLEYLLETRMDSKPEEFVSDTFIEDFLLTHIVFMPSSVLCNCLMWYYQQGAVPGAALPRTADMHGQLKTAMITTEHGDHFFQSKRRVIGFVQIWTAIAKHTFYDDKCGAGFIEELYCALLEDRKHYNRLHSQNHPIECLLRDRNYQLAAKTRKPLTVFENNILSYNSRSFVRPSDTCVVRVHRTDFTYVTLQIRLDKKAEDIKRMACKKLGLGNGDGVELFEVRSSGERIIFRDDEIGIGTLLTINGRLFVAFEDQVETTVPLSDQLGPTESVHAMLLDTISSTEFAYHLVAFHWNLFTNTHEYEFIYRLIGQEKLTRLSPNLDILIRRFNEVQYFVVTEIVLCQNLTKRVNLIKKFLKIAHLCKNYQDLYSFFAIVLGLSNIAVSRLTATWTKLSAKCRKQFLEYEALLDPSRNHRAYRLMIAKLTSPIIPFVPLILKDLTFIFEGNKTHFDGLVNFEKMHMMATGLQLLRNCRSLPMALEPPVVRSKYDVETLVKNFYVIDSQLRLTQLSCLIEQGKSQVT